MMRRLLQIKAFREQRAAADMHRCRLLVEQRQRQLEIAEEKLVTHRRCRIDQEEADFAAIRGQAVPLHRLEMLQARGARLREAEALLHQEVLEAEEKLRQAHDAWEESRRTHAAAAREHEKIQQLAKLEQETLMQKRNRNEEAELEEHATPRRRS